MGGVASPAAAASCEKLANAIVPNGSITVAQSIPAGDYTAPSGTIYPNMPAFCRVAATLTPTSDSFIRIEVWMPVNDWNNAYLATGGGGILERLVTASSRADSPKASLQLTPTWAPRRLRRWTEGL